MSSSTSFLPEEINGSLRKAIELVAEVALFTIPEPEGVHPVPKEWVQAAIGFRSDSHQGRLVLAAPNGTMQTFYERLVGETAPDAAAAEDVLFEICNMVCGRLLGMRHPHDAFQLSREPGSPRIVEGEMVQLDSEPLAVAVEGV